MNFNHLLLFCFLSATLRGDISVLVDAKTLFRTEGSSIVVECPFSLFGRTKFLCRDGCKEEDILIQTRGDRAQSGRYGILYKEGSSLVSSSVVIVIITQLNKSDQGRYRCGLERAFLPDSYWEFDIRVTDAPKPFPEIMKQSEQQQTAETTSAAAVHSSVKGSNLQSSTVRPMEALKVSRPGHTLPLLVCLTVVVLSAVVVLLLYRCRTGVGLTTRGQSDERNTEFTTYENCSKHQDDASPAVDDQDKIYSNL
ncbi:uncharacterized protein LOC115585340 [Sparus aurata]|uniref:uncharacterized protein LOC115585340 n=1 Tax=Sparus aurata TaxID=8175 RepID=UPI0011C1B0B6|nr:uncharacterized protein LOC115585340 [Sparus aurata]